MDESTLWVKFRDNLISVFRDDYSMDDIFWAYSCCQERFYEALEELNKEEN